MDTKLYVGNLSYSVTEDELREMFAQAGSVTSVAVIKDRDTGQSKGFAFIEFSTQADAQKAISRFNGQKLGERTGRTFYAVESPASCCSRRAPGSVPVIGGTGGIIGLSR